MNNTSPDLASFLNLIIFGKSADNDDPLGGVAGACSLTESQVVEEDDPGDRPSYPFMTFKLSAPGSEVKYGPVHNPYREVTEDGNDAKLHFRNARDYILRLYFYGQRPTQTFEYMWGLANTAQRYLTSTANRELNLLDIAGRVVAAGEMRDASTVLNAATEIRVGMDVDLIIGELYTVGVGAFDDVTLEMSDNDGDIMDKVVEI
jgi:hypothetical protein